MIEDYPTYSLGLVMAFTLYGYFVLWYSTQNHEKISKRWSTFKPWRKWYDFVLVSPLLLFVIMIWSAGGR